MSWALQIEGNYKKIYRAAFLFNRILTHTRLQVPNQSIFLSLATTQGLARKRRMWTGL